MHIYRCYFLNADDQIQAFEVIEVASLSEGIGRAQAMLKARPQHRSVELWDGSRRLYPARYGNVLPAQRCNGATGSKVNRPVVASCGQQVLFAKQDDQHDKGR